MNPRPRGHDLIVQMGPLDPFSPGCMAALEQPSPTPSASPDPLAGTNPCSVLTDAQVHEAIGWGVSGEAHLSGLSGGMRDCVYFSGGSTGLLSLSLRLLSTSAEDGRELARELFGAGVTESIVGDARVYANGCVEPPVSCEPAIAISSAPYFVVLWNADPREITPEQALAALADLVVASLETR